MTGLDLWVMGVYFVVVFAVGAIFARQSSDADYFLGGHQVPWWAVMLSIVATETSALTIISLPGIAARSNLGMLQLAMGYVLGRLAVSAWLLPGYFRGEQLTAYARLETRFGPLTRRVASGTFMLVRSLGDSVRVFATAIPLAIVTGWSIPTSIVVVVAASVANAWLGGIKGVIWLDVGQLGLYVFAGIAVVVTAVGAAGGLETAWATAAAAGRLKVWNFDLDWSTPYTFWSGLIGGALLTAASHGTDHLIVQRVLSTANLAAARRALIGSGLVVLTQFALFLGAGAALFAAGADDGVMPSDALFPRFVVSHLRPGLSGLVVAGILAASTVSSSINSLASATTHDFYVALTGKTDQRHLVRVGRAATLAWAVLMTVGALLFSQGAKPVVELALSFASITYGGLLGTYILGGLGPRVMQPHAITGLLCGVGATAVVVLGRPPPFDTLGWPWLVPLGTSVTVAVGWLLASLAPLAQARST